MAIIIFVIIFIKTPYLYKCIRTASLFVRQRIILVQNRTESDAVTSTEQEKTMFSDAIKSTPVEYDFTTNPKLLTKDEQLIGLKQITQSHAELDGLSQENELVHGSIAEIEVGISRLNNAAHLIEASL